MQTDGQTDWLTSIKLQKLLCSSHSSAEHNNKPWHSQKSQAINKIFLNKASNFINIVVLHSSIPYHLCRSDYIRLRVEGVLHSFIRIKIQLMFIYTHLSIQYVLLIKDYIFESVLGKLRSFSRSTLVHNHLPTF